MKKLEGSKSDPDSQHNSIQHDVGGDVGLSLIAAQGVIIIENCSYTPRRR